MCTNTKIGKTNNKNNFFPFKYGTKNIISLGLKI